MCAGADEAEGQESPPDERRDADPELATPASAIWTHLLHGPAYAARDTGDNRKPLFTITIKRDTAGAADDNKQVITKMPVTIYTYDNAENQTKTEKNSLPVKATTRAALC